MASIENPIYGIVYCSCITVEPAVDEKGPLPRPSRPSRRHRRARKRRCPRLPLEPSERAVEVARYVRKSSRIPLGACNEQSANLTSCRGANHGRWADVVVAFLIVATPLSGAHLNADDGAAGLLDPGEKASL